MAQAILGGLFALSIAPIADLISNDTGKTSRVTDLFSSVFDSLEIPFTLSTVFVATSAIVLFSGLFTVLTKYVNARVKYDVLTILLTETMTSLLSARFEFLQSRI